MAAEVIMPQMGFDMKEGTLVRWLKQVGEEVAQGEPIAEIETDKAVVEIEAFAAGVFRKSLIEEGTTVPVGEVIGIIAGADEALPEVAAPKVLEKAEAATSGAASAAPPATATAAPPATGPGGRIKASPLARKEAETLGIDIGLVAGTGPAGRITRKDVMRFAADGGAAAPATPAPQPPPAAAPAPTAAPASAPATAPSMPALGELVPLTRMRQAIARNMARSKQEVPHIYITVPIDMTEALHLRGQLNKALEGDVRVSVNDFVIRAAAMAVAKYPIANAVFTEEGVQVQPRINIGMAIALDDGLVAPGIIDADRKGLPEIARESKALAERARAGKLGAQEYTGATFNVTNLGMYGVESFTAIITPPQAGALAVGAVAKEPAVVDGEVVVRDVMRVTLSLDHRVADGALGAQLVVEVKELLENPVRLLL